MTIRQRIIALISLSFVALTLVSGYAIVQSRSSATEVKTVTENVVPSAIDSVALMGQLKDVQMAAMAMVAATDPESVRKGRDELAARQSALKQSLKEQLERADSEAQKGLVKMAEESLENYFGAINDTAGFMLAGQKTLAEANMAATVDQYLREQAGVIDTLQVEKKRSKDSAIENMNANLSSTVTMLTLTTLAAVLVLSAVGLVLYRRIILPLLEMERKMTEIADSQDFSHRLPVRNDDEIGHSVTAFNKMIEKIEESSELIRQQSADIHAMLHYIPQGILTLEPGNRIHNEYSDYLTTILETDQIAGRGLMEVVFSNSNLGADTLSQVETAAAACIGEDEMNFSFNSHLLVSEIQKTMADGRTKILDLSWSPITDESGAILRLLLCVRDVTELKALEQAAQAQREELAIIGEILSLRQEKFQEFLRTAQNLLAENEMLLNNADALADPDKRRECIGLLFRNMHTIKGNARTHGLQTLTHTVHEAEACYDLQRQNPEAWSPDQLRHELYRVRDELSRYARVNQDKLGRNNTPQVLSSDGAISVPAHEVEQTIAALEDSTLDVTARLQMARDRLHQLGSESISQALGDVTASVATLASELGKDAPDCVIQDQGIRIRTRFSGLLRNVFTHLYRNAVDHGLESSEERAVKGKPARGTITLTADLDEQRLCLRLRDDGRGLATAAIGHKALQAGLIPGLEGLQPSDLAELIFHSGFSTAEQVTMVSGRGVGMDAVRGFLEAQGGGITIELLNDDPHSDYHPFETVISLPAGCAVRTKAPLAI